MRVGTVVSSDTFAELPQPAALQTEPPHAFRLAHTSTSHLTKISSMAQVLTLLTHTHLKAIFKRLIESKLIHRDNNRNHNLFIALTA